MKYQVRHMTRYCYSAPVTQAHSMAHLLPRETATQNCLKSELLVKPYSATSSRHTDYFGNNVCHVTVQSTHREMEVTALTTIEKSPPEQNLNLEIGNSIRNAKQQLGQANSIDTMLAREFVLDSPMVKASLALADYAAPCFSEDRPLLSAVRALTRKIFDEFTFDPKFSSIATPLDDVMKHRRGVCQDFAHLTIGCLRALGFPARYVSGYLETLPPEGQEKLVGADASHAWLAVYSPGEGWVDFDPTNDQLAGEQHITTAWGRDYSDVAPLKGIVFGGGDSQSMEVEVDVTCLDS